MKPEECKNSYPPNQVCDHCQVGEWKGITDPEELFRLKREGWEIEVDTGPHWEKWKAAAWMNYMEYRARPPKPKAVTKKLCAWVHGISGDTIYRFDDIDKDGDWIRQPHLDKEVEIPES